MVEENLNQDLNDNHQTKNMKKKVAKVLSNIVSGVMIIVIAALVFFLVQAKLTGGPPALAGYQMYIVVSGSMSPTFDAGSLIFVEPLEPKEIEIGDMITFKGTNANQKLTTHRVVEINQSSDGISFTTKGDANEVEDFNPVLGEQLVGKVTFAVPYLGYFLEFSQTKQGLLILIIIPSVLIIISEFRNLFKYAAKLDEEKSKEKLLCENIEVTDVKLTTNTVGKDDPIE